MRRHRSFLTRSFVVAAALAATLTMPESADSAPAAKKQVQVWKVEQVSQLEGPITLYIGSAGVKMVVPAQHVVVVSVPPKWDVDSRQ